jgi:hypothetical protein
MFHKRKRLFTNVISKKKEYLLQKTMDRLIHRSVGKYLQGNTKKTGIE